MPLVPYNNLLLLKVFFMLNIISRNGSYYVILTLKSEVIYQLLVTLQRVMFIIEEIVEIFIFQT